ncbi:MAG TPA: alpha/beta fold hydrolase, partial [Cyclobacteriaceae bacterium]|nr:alpha/beta fold hydrolase [Cyclobacteriaceae bacterium]
MKFAPKEIIVKENKVSYFDEGSGVPLIFIHGFPFNKWMWEKQIAALKKNYRCIAYDVHGHGESSASRSMFSISQFADDLIDFMDVLSLEKAAICGLSMGGYIALHAVEKVPKRILALALCDTQCKGDSDEARDKRFRTISFIQQTGLSIYANESVKNLFAPASFEMRKAEVDFIKGTIVDCLPENVCKTLMALANRKNTCDVLQTLKMPVLILVGSEDTVTPIAVA